MTVSRLMFGSLVLLSAAVSWSNAELPLIKLQPLPAPLLPAAVYRKGRQLTTADTSTLKVIINGTAAVALEHSTALFGIPAYGRVITGKLYYPQYENSTGCQPITDSRIPPSSILLLRSGQCSYTTMVLHAQEAHAIAAIVIDDAGICGPEEGVCNMNGPNCGGCPYYETSTSCHCGLHYMGDDGKGSFVSIPSMMVSLASGMKLISDLDAGANVLASMQWDIPNADGQVELAFWGHVNDDTVTRVRHSLAPYIHYFGGSIKFIPHWFLWYGPDSGCGTSACGSQCVNNGLYCSMDPDGDTGKGVSGGDIVLESVRQMCLWEWLQPQYSKYYGQVWWDYSEAVVKNCVDSYSRDCSEQEMRSLGVDIGAIRDCVQDANSTFNTSQGIYINKLLQKEVDLMHQMDIKWLPTILVNDIVIQGSSSPSVVFDAVCAGFGHEYKPDVCQCVNLDINQLDQCVSSVSGQSVPTARLPGWSVAVIATLSVLFVGIIVAVAIFYARTRSRMQRLEDRYVTLVGPDGVQSPAAQAGNNSSGGRGNFLTRLFRPQPPPVPDANAVTVQL